MNTVTIEVADRATADARFLGAFKTGQTRGASIMFDSVETLWQVLSPKRWQIVRTLCGVGPVSLREAARRVGRDVKAVHGDVHALLAAGVLEKSDDGRIVFPYDAVHVDFTVQPEGVAA
ncbi:MAG: DNA-binding protein [Ottowia sp.]|jgi:predicted transcriptional regulator|uniref:HVO_A0114 family putative DNA-binding protein n=1 Tax=Ottowia sp. TaxID=1898956 RepID=UPI0011D829A8|nr:DNA-binding protein [Ottowia sp.]HRL36547.1 DNA-binding protein [Ottowia beijingensis]MBP7458308.1 DNA-binding protein [Ottowia sp.]MBP8861284.1 DNA-binding protein [Ottowia sp.]MBP8928443.1 DNA-binding protein [Ottowia sp.]MBP9524250.1 DNA-binding protein [Ottowia sp.]